MLGKGAQLGRGPPALRMGDIDELAGSLRPHVNDRETARPDVRAGYEGGQKRDAEPGHRRIPHHVTVVNAQAHPRANDLAAPRGGEALVGDTPVRIENALVRIELGGGLRPALVGEIVGRGDQHASARCKTPDHQAGIVDYAMPQDRVMGTGRDVDAAVVKVERKFDPGVGG